MKDTLIAIIVGLIVTVVGGVIVAYLIQDARFKPLEPIVQTLPAAQTPLSTTTEATNWAFTLEYRFPDGFWSSGTHSYSFAFTCPDGSDRTTRQFIVSDQFPPKSGDVYLRWSALRVGNPWGEVVDGLNPSQPTVASVAWDAITKSEAEWRASNCTGTISWDGGGEQPLTGIPFQRQ